MVRITAQPIDVAAQQAVLGLLPHGPVVVPDTDVAAPSVTAAPSTGGYGADARSGERPRGGLVDVFA